MTIESIFGYKICGPEHWGMFSLQLDFIRHSLVNLVGGFVTAPDYFKLLKRYFELIQNPLLLQHRAQYILTNNMGTSHLGIPYISDFVFQIEANYRVSSDGTSPIVFLQGRLGKAKSSNVAQTIRQCSGEHLPNHHYDFRDACMSIDRIESEAKNK